MVFSSWLPLSLLATDLGPVAHHHLLMRSSAISVERWGIIVAIAASTSSTLLGNSKRKKIREKSRGW